MGFKFQFYHEQISSTPKSLYDLASKLIQHKYLTVMELYPHLRPTDDEAQSTQKALFDNTEKDVRSIRHSTLDKNDVSKDRVKILKEASTKEVRESQKFGLLESLIENNDWVNADLLIQKMGHYCVGVANNISRSICKQLHVLVEPLYRPIYDSSIYTSGMSDNKKAVVADSSVIKQLYLSEMHNFRTQIFPLLKHLGPYLACDLVMFCKLCRIFKFFFQCCNVEIANDPIRDELISIITTVLLPAYTLVYSNPAMGQEVFNALHHLPFEERYQIYGLWKESNQYPLVTMVRMVAWEETKRHFQRLTAENSKPYTRIIGKLSHSHPFIVAEAALSRIRSYPNFTVPFLETIKFINSFSFDILCYFLLCELATGEGKANDGYSNAQGVIYLAQFSGRLFAKFPHKADITAMFNYIHNQILLSNTSHLVLLKEIIEI
jgi:THO complex subunit 2